eukprot:TRINITY_DN24043_c2_g3_i1.p1 TRINITY_DN24043_c2_g3~~TRINITY_DN24043_c2_g3_i1.p1  ORF type:complete len:302 (+),score=53.15 TRINITY_DN24043_c2_g3_i1:148-1053(+)
MSTDAGKRFARAILALAVCGVRQVQSAPKKDNQVQRSGWELGEEPDSDRCHVALLSTTGSTCCWMEKRVEQFRTQSRGYRRWACVARDEACEDMAHRLVYHGESSHVHTCDHEVTTYVLYRLSMQLSLIDASLSLTKDLMPEIDVAVENGIQTMLNVTHDSVAISTGAKVITTGKHTGGAEVVVHFAADDNLIAQRSEALAQHDHDEVMRCTLVLKRIGQAMNSSNALADTPLLAYHISEALDGPLKSAQVSWLKVTLSNGTKVEKTGFSASMRMATSDFGIRILLLCLYAMVFLNKGAFP